MNCCDYDCNCPAHSGKRHTSRRVRPYPSVIVGEPDEAAGMPSKFDEEGLDEAPDGLMVRAENVTGAFELFAKVVAVVVMVLAVLVPAAKALQAFGVLP